MAQQAEACRQRRPPLGFVLELGRNPERLAEIFLMEPLCSICCCGTIIPLDDKYPGLLMLVDESPGHLQADLTSQGHAESLVFNRAIQVFDCRFDDVIGRERAVIEMKVLVIVKDRQFLLRPGQ